LQARAQFAQAEFADAANSYRKLLENDPKKLDYVEAYAIALAAADRQSAAREFRSWVDSVRGEKPRNANVEQTGLDLLAGNSAGAQKLDSALQAGSDEWAPDDQGELGWWYYISSDYEHAAKLLDAAVQQRPGRLRLRVRRAWVAIENRRFADALQTTGEEEERTDREESMLKAVAFWQSKEADTALEDFTRATLGQPEWNNPHWVRALYSPLVAKCVQEMQAKREERERQGKARLTANH